MSSIDKSYQNRLICLSQWLGRDFCHRAIFSFFPLILKFSMGHFLTFYTDSNGPFFKWMGLWRMALCLPNHCYQKWTKWHTKSEINVSAENCNILLQHCRSSCRSFPNFIDAVMLKSVSPKVLTDRIHTCQVGKVKKMEISLFASCQRGWFCAKPFHGIFFLSRNIQIQAQFFNMGTYSLFLLAYNSLYDAKTFQHCTWLTICWLLIQCIFIGKFNRIYSF